MEFTPDRASNGDEVSPATDVPSGSEDGSKAD
jgi:hypothetical protein